MTEKEQQFLDNLITLTKSFTSQKLNRQYILELMQVLRCESLDHGDRAVLAYHRLQQEFKEL